MRNRELRVEGVDKQDGNPPVYELSVQGKIRVRKPALRALHNDSGNIVAADEVGQHVFLPLKRVIRKGDLYRISSLEKRALNALYGLRKNIAVHIGRQHRDPVTLFQIFPAVKAHIGSAALDPAHRALLFQYSDCFSDCLPADAEPLREFILRRQLISRLQLFLVY